jgi:hypothetical protein
MIDPNRFTTVKVKDLTLVNLYDRVLVLGKENHAGQLLGWDSEDDQYFYLLLGPTEHLRRYLVSADADIQILDAETMRTPVGHFAV